MPAVKYTRTPQQGALLRCRRRETLQASMPSRETLAAVLRRREALNAALPGPRNAQCRAAAAPCAEGRTAAPCYVERRANGELPA